MLDAFQLSQIAMYKGFSFITRSKTRERNYLLVARLIQQGIFYHVKYSRHSSKFYCFEIKEDYFADPQKCKEFKFNDLKYLFKSEYRQSTIYDFGA